MAPVSIDSHGIILVLFKWIIKQDYLKNIESLETGASLLEVLRCSQTGLPHGHESENTHDTQDKGLDICTRKSLSVRLEFVTFSHTSRKHAYIILTPLNPTFIQ